jgi:hypothetical protein
MKKIILLLLAFYCCGHLTHGQTIADIEISDLVNSGDYIRLNQRYEAAHDSLLPFVTSVSEAFIDYALNKPERGVGSMSHLIDYYARDLGASLPGFTILYAEQLYLSGRYAEAADKMRPLIEPPGTLTAPYDSPESLATLSILYRTYAALRQTPPMRVRRMPAHSTDVKLLTDVPMAKIGWTMPVTIGRTEAQLLLDTGAPRCMMSDEMARKAGVRIVADSIPVSGLGGSGYRYTKLGVIDTLRIGPLECLNEPVSIADEDGILPRSIREAIGSDIEIILGINLMRSMGIIEVAPVKGTISFPETNESAGTYPNMMIVNDSPSVEAYVGEQRLLINFDTGGSAESVYIKPDFASEHEVALKVSDRQETRSIGGFLGISRRSVRRLLDFSIRIGNKETPLDDAFVSEGSAMQAGCLSLPYFNRMSKITFDFDRMSLTVQ